MKFEREKIVVLFAPLAIVLAGYSCWYNFFQRPKSQAVERAYRTALAAEPKLGETIEQQLRKTRLDREAAELQKRIADLEAQSPLAAVQDADARKRIESEKQLGALLRKHGLRIMDEDLASKNRQFRLPASVAEALGRFGKPDPRRAAQIRRFRLSGTFIDVLAAVDELAAMQSPPGVPISLSMAEADVQDPRCEWTLSVWM